MINEILLNKMEKIRTLTNINPDNARLDSFFMYYKSSNNNKYKFFALVLP